MSRVLVTGGNGFIGKYVVKYLLDCGYEVIVSTVNTDGIDSRAQVTTFPIFSDDPELYSKLGSPDICIHLAWKDGFNHNSDSHMDNLSNHVRFCRKMMSSGLKILSCAGSMHEVGYWEGEINEKTPCNPLSQYGIAKNAFRQSLLLSNNYECAVNWLRGYYIESTDTRGKSIFSKIAQAEQEGKTTFPFNSGKNLYDFLPIELFAKYICIAGTQNKINGIIEICSGQPQSLSERIEQFIKNNGYSIKLDYGKFPDRPYDSPGIWGNPEKLHKILERCP